MPERKPKDEKCAKCEAPMERGYLPGPGTAVLYPMFLAIEWTPGRAPASHDMSTTKSAKKRRRISTWRCTACGYLEFYAH